MGISMLMILAFHLSSGYEIQPFKTLFSRGFYGVDIFLFFSALGLCYSYNNNTLTRFYLNRIRRVLPLFLLLALFRIIWHIGKGETVTHWDVVATMTGISYFKFFGGIWVDWYLSALLFLYLLFPLIYKYMNITVWGGEIVVVILSSVFCLFVPHYWEHACLIGRLPIFCLGILYYFVTIKNTVTMNNRIFLALILYGICLLSIDIVFPNGKTRFLAPSFFAPILIVLLSRLYLWTKEYIPQFVIFVNFIGKHSLEIYVANCFSIYICQEKGMNLIGYTGMLYELLIMEFIACILYYVNRFVTNKI